MYNQHSNQPGMHHYAGGYNQNNPAFAGRPMGHQAHQQHDQGTAANQQSGKKTVDNAERLRRAEGFFNELRHLPLGGNDYFNNTGKLTDMTRLLQVLTNTSYLEAKTHSLITKRGAEKQQMRNQTGLVSAITKNDGNAFSLNRLLSADNQMLETTNKQSYDPTEQNNEFDKLQLDGAEKEEIEAQKILNKRQRRVGKVEDFNVDIHSIFKNKKRFKPDMEASASVLAGGVNSQALSKLTDNRKADLKQILVHSYIDQVVEHDSANELILSKFKTMLKNIQVGNLTSIKSQQDGQKAAIDVSREERFLIGFIVETEPELFSDVASYLLFSKFILESSASNYTSEATTYMTTFEFLLECFETNQNLALFNQAAFAKWMSFLQKIPDLKSTRLQVKLRQHFKTMLEKIRVNQAQQFYSCLIKQVLVSKMALKQELQGFTMDHLVESLVMDDHGKAADEEESKLRMSKALAIFSLLFVKKDEGEVKESASGQLQILAEDKDNQKTLFEQMQAAEQKHLKDAILYKFRGVFELKAHKQAPQVKADEARIAIKLFIYAFKSKTDSPFAFQEYFRMCMQQQLNQQSGAEQTGTYLLQGLPDLLSTIEIKLKSNDDVVLKVLRDALSRGAKHLADNQPYLGLLIDHFCKAEQKVAHEFTKQVVKLSQRGDVDFTHFGFPLLAHMTGENSEASYLKQILPGCFLHPNLPALTANGQPPALTPQLTIETLEKMNLSTSTQVELISLLIEKSPEDLQQILSKQIVFSNILISKFTPSLTENMQPAEYTTLLRKCLVTSLIESLIRHDKWTCRLLVRILLIFLKQAASVTKAQKELEQPIVEHGADIISQILSKRLWDKIPNKIANGDWQNLKHGLIIFASNYQENAKVKETFQKYLPEESSIREEFCRDSEIMKTILGNPLKSKEPSVDQKSQKSEKSEKKEANAE